MANDRAAQDLFGNQVSISNDYALVSAYQDDDYGSNSGSIYVFKKTGSDWVRTKFCHQMQLEMNDLVQVLTSQMVRRSLALMALMTMATTAGQCIFIPFNQKRVLSV